MLESPQWGNSNTYPKHMFYEEICFGCVDMCFVLMFYEEIRTKQNLSYISICSLSILYNSKFILMAMSLGTNDVVVTRVHCIYLWIGWFVLPLFWYDIMTLFLISLFRYCSLEIVVWIPFDIMRQIFLYLFEPWREKTYLLTCAPNKDSNQPAHPRSLTRVFVIRIKKLCIIGYTKYANTKYCANAQADLNLRWAHMSDGTFSYVAARNRLNQITSSYCQGKLRK